MDEALLLAGARSLVRILGAKLSDTRATDITLDRDEAVLALGFIEAAADQLQAELLRHDQSDPKQG